MLFAENVKDGSRPGTVLLSAAAHAAVAGLIFLAMHTGRTRPVPIESRCCSTALYWSPNASPGSPKPKPARHRKLPAPAPTPVDGPAIAAAPAVAAQVAQTQTGQTSPQELASLGIGTGANDGEPALPLYFPSPNVADRTLLPIAKQNVVVEVSINATGDVIDEKLVRGLGNSLDQIVLNTVKGWRFHPATLNGNAVASTEELVFPFDKNWQPNAAGSFEG